MRNDPKVIAAYLGVEDEEVGEGRSRDAARSQREGHVDERARRACGSPPRVRGVKTYYGNIIALKGVDLDVHEGEIVTLIGANGAGKSTLMMTIFGSPRAREGTITFAGQDITRCRRTRSRGCDRPVAGGAPHLPAHDRRENLQMGAAVDEFAHFDEDLERVLHRCSRA